MTLIEFHDTKINNYNFAIVTNSTYFISGSVSPSDKVPSKATGVKVWPIAVSVVVAVIIVVLIVLMAIWMKWRWNRGIPRFGYKKHEDDMAPLETSMEL